MLSFVCKINDSKKKVRKKLILVTENVLSFQFEVYYSAESWPQKKSKKLGIKLNIMKMGSFVIRYIFCVSGNVVGDILKYNGTVSSHINLTCISIYVVAIAIP